jgi:hypothetical protein
LKLGTVRGGTDLSIHEAVVSEKTAKERAFTTFVHPTIEYAAAVWDPPTQRNINALERDTPPQESSYNVP